MDEHFGSKIFLGIAAAVALAFLIFVVFDFFSGAPKVLRDQRRSSRKAQRLQEKQKEDESNSK